MADVRRLVTRAERESLEKMATQMNEAAGEDDELVDPKTLLSAFEESQRLFALPEDQRGDEYRRLKAKYGDGFAASGPGIPNE